MKAFRKACSALLFGAFAGALACSEPPTAASIESGDLPRIAREVITSVFDPSLVKGKVTVSDVHNPSSATQCDVKLAITGGLVAGATYKLWGNVPVLGFSQLAVFTATRRGTATITIRDFESAGGQVVTLRLYDESEGNEVVLTTDNPQIQVAERCGAY